LYQISGCFNSREPPTYLLLIHFSTVSPKNLTLGITMISLREFAREVRFASETTPWSVGGADRPAGHCAAGAGCALSRCLYCALSRCQYPLSLSGQKAFVFSFGYTHIVFQVLLFPVKFRAIDKNCTKRLDPFFTRASRFGLRTQNSNQHILYGCRVGNSK